MKILIGGSNKAAEPQNRLLGVTRLVIADRLVEASSDTLFHLYRVVERRNDGLFVALGVSLTVFNIGQFKFYRSIYGVSLWT